MTSNAYTLTPQPTTTNELRAHAFFPITHPAFQGHFPNNPILPGFLHIQLALDLLRAANFPHILKEIQTAKFTPPIPPTQKSRSPSSPQAQTSTTPLSP